MVRTIASVVAGILAWVVIVTLLNFGIRALIPAYHAAEPMMVFTLTMKIARLFIAALTSVLAGAIVKTIAPSSKWAPWIAGGILLALFVPEHIYVWAKFPVWYHLTFLLTLLPLILLGARLARRA